MRVSVVWVTGFVLALVVVSPAIFVSAEQGLNEGERVPLTINRIYADENGDTHWETLTLLTEAPRTPRTGSTATLGSVGLPLTGNLTFHRIAGDLVIPNPEPNGEPHTAPNRTYIFVLSGSGFWWNSTTNQQVEFRPGSVLLADDTGSQGHNTAAMGTETVFMFVPIGGGPAPRRPCARAPVVLECLLSE